VPTEVYPSPRPSAAPRKGHWSVTLKREALKWSRTLHIYLSLSAFVMFLFFAVTGVMLTHDSFGLDVVKAVEAKSTIPVTVAKGTDENAIVAAVRAALKITIPVTQFNPADDQIEIDFAGPSRRAQVFITRDSGEAHATFENRGFIGLMADLHKGAETGWAWRYVLDITSVWIALSSITGMIMLLALPKRRRLGLIITVVGALIAIAAYAAYVPR
jgi:uncharacterized protein